MQIILNGKHELVGSTKERGFSLTGNSPVKHNSTLFCLLNSIFSDFAGMIYVLKSCSKSMETFLILLSFNLHCSQT